jgi:hypothetical protein
VVRRKTAFHSPNRQNVELRSNRKKIPSAGRAQTAFCDRQLVRRTGMIDKNAALLAEEDAA